MKGRHTNSDEHEEETDRDRPWPSRRRRILSSPFDIQRGAVLDMTEYFLGVGYKHHGEAFDLDMADDYDG